MVIPSLLVASRTFFTDLLEGYYPWYSVSKGQGQVT